MKLAVLESKDFLRHISSHEAVNIDAIKKSDKDEISNLVKLAVFES